MQELCNGSSWANTLNQFEIHTYTVRAKKKKKQKTNYDAKLLEKVGCFV